jgi:hypothetical protein
MTRRSSRRRGRRGTPPAPGTAPGPAPATPPPPAKQPKPGFGRATLILALLLGTLVERTALRLPIDALDIFHFAVLASIALLAARAYRGFARRAVERSRERRRNR